MLKMTCNIHVMYNYRSYGCVNCIEYMYTLLLKLTKLLNYFLVHKVQQDSSGYYLEIRTWQI